MPKYGSIPVSVEVQEFRMEILTLFFSFHLSGKVGKIPGVPDRFQYFIIPYICSLPPYNDLTNCNYIKFYPESFLVRFLIYAICNVQRGRGNYSLRTKCQ